MTNSEGLTVTELASVGMLFEQHRDRLLTMVQRRIDPTLAVRIDPEEILHEAFLQACRKWSRFQEETQMTPYAWLYRVVVDCLIERWRRESRSKRDLRREIPWPEQSSIQLGLQLVTSGTSPSEAAQREELRQHVQEALECLSDQDQEILWMRHFDQLSFREAAMVLNVSENAATVRYARALRRLRDLWMLDQKRSKE